MATRIALDASPSVNFPAVGQGSSGGRGGSVGSTAKLRLLRHTILWFQYPLICGWEWGSRGSEGALDNRETDVELLTGNSMSGELLGQKRWIRNRRLL